jgi:hypothetical protein
VLILVEFGFFAVCCSPLFLSLLLDLVRLTSDPCHHPHHGYVMCILCCIDVEILVIFSESTMTNYLYKHYFFLNQSDVADLLSVGGKGGGGGSGNGSINQRIHVNTWVPKEINLQMRRKLFQIAANVYEANKKRSMVIFGPQSIKASPDVMWPYAPLNVLFPEEQSAPLGGRKSIGMHLPNLLDVEGDWRVHTTFYFLKDDEILFDISYANYMRFVEAIHHILTYLRSVDSFNLIEFEFSI